jgi:2'-5' RNA ligase
MKKKPNSIRTFIAIELPLYIIAEIADLQIKLMQSGLKVRWVKPENVHLTLKFLGDIPASAVEPVGQAMARSTAHHSPFRLSLGTLGCFPHLRRPRVIWLGVAGQTDGLCRLHQKLENSLMKLGFKKDSRPFKGHLTLARVKKKPLRPTLADVLSIQPSPSPLKFDVQTIALFQSRLKPTGAVYTKLVHLPLKS